MQSAVSNRILLGVFAALAVTSVGLKAAAGPPPDGYVDTRPLETELQIMETLHAQGFSTKLVRREFQSSVVYGQRGSCRLSARSARGGVAESVVFSREGSSIGPVRYLYRARSYNSPPTFSMRLGRLEAEMLGRIGLQRRVQVPIALATSQGCGPNNFRLDNVEIVS